MSEKKIRLISGDDVNDMLQVWAAERLAKHFDMPPAAMVSPDNRAIGVILEGKLIACAVYYNYQPWFGTIQMSIAADNPRWCTRGVIAALLDYPFRIGCKRIWVLTKQENKRINRLLKWIGFVPEGVLVGFFGVRRNAIPWRMMRGGYSRFLQRIGREGSSGCPAAVQKAEVQRPRALAS